MEFILFILFALAAALTIAFLLAIVTAIINLVLLPFRMIGYLFSTKPIGRKIETTSPPDRYASNWSHISKVKKEKESWTCQKCKIYLGRTDHRKLLHVHHVNRNPLDNRDKNLLALCLVCHSEQPGKGHKRLRGAIIKDGRWNLIHTIRKS